MDFLIRLLRALGALLFAVLVCGVLYPALVTGLATVLPGARSADDFATPELAAENTNVGYDWRDTGLFEGRPAPEARKGASTGSNLALTNPAFAEDVQKRAALWRERVGGNEPVPVALVTASASGQDPDLPMRAAIYQIPYVARNTGLSPKRLDAIVHAVMRREMIRFGFERLVNVAELNAAVLAEMKKEGKTLGKPTTQNRQETPS